MKYFIYLLAFSFFISCSKKEATPPPVTQQGFKIEVQENSRLSTGEFVPYPKDAIINVWKADNRALEVKSLSDAMQGYAWDRTSMKSIKSDYAAISYEMVKSADPGQYFVFVALKDNFSYSLISFSLNPNGWMPLKKVFTTHASYAAYEEWFAHE